MRFVVDWFVLFIVTLQIVTLEACVVKLQLLEVFDCDSGQKKATEKQNPVLPVVG